MWDINTLKVLCMLILHWRIVYQQLNYTKHVAKACRVCWWKAWFASPLFVLHHRFCAALLKEIYVSIFPFELDPFLAHGNEFLVSYLQEDSVFQWLCLVMTQTRRTEVRLCLMLKGWASPVMAYAAWVGWGSSPVRTKGPPVIHSHIPKNSLLSWELKVHSANKCSFKRIISRWRSVPGWFLGLVCIELPVKITSRSEEARKNTWGWWAWDLSQESSPFQDQHEISTGSVFRWLRQQREAPKSKRGTGRCTYCLTFKLHRRNRGWTLVHGGPYLLEVQCDCDVMVIHAVLYTGTLPPPIGPVDGVLNGVLLCNEHGTGHVTWFPVSSSPHQRGN